MNNSYPLDFGLEAFSVCFGIEPDQIPEDCRTLIEQSDFRYRLLEPAERDETVLKVLRRVDENQVAVAGEKRLEDWERGWGENRNSYLESGKEEDLIPKYIRPGLPLRFKGEFIQSADENFEFNWYSIYRH